MLDKKRKASANASALELLRIITPILVMISITVTAAIYRKVDMMEQSMTSVRERIAVVETILKIEQEKNNGHERR